MNAGTEYTGCMQYTLRNVPEALDQALRRRAREEGVSLNQAALAAMARGIGLEGSAQRFREVSGLAGSWLEDPDFDRVVEEMDRIDEALWR